MKHPRSAPRRGRDGGFSLVEVLVSLTLLAVFIAASFQVYAGALRATVAAGDHARAQNLARSRLNALAADPALAPGEESGQVVLDEGARILRWRTEITDYPLLEVDEVSPESPARPLLAVVEVTWNGNDGPAHGLELRALLLGEAE